MSTYAAQAYDLLGAPSFRATTPSVSHATTYHHSSPPLSLPVDVYRANRSNRNKYMNPPPPLHYTQTQPHHGTKRSAPSDEIENSANISTHFKKLRLNNAQLPHPSTISPVGVSLRSSHDRVPSQPQQQDIDPTSINETSRTRLRSADTTNIHPPSTSDFMPIDDTPNRIYIHDLDSEIAAIEASETLPSSSFLLPDFDKSVSQIPSAILNHKPGSAAGSRVNDSQALVLYRDPISISVPPEEDVVRKAIIAARREAREKMKQDYAAQVQGQDSQHEIDTYRQDDPDSNSTAVAVAGGMSGMLGAIPEKDEDEAVIMEDDDHPMNDPDAMEIE